MSRTYYQALEINDFSNREEIVQAYRRLAMKWHPDRNNNPDAEQIFIEIQTAYEILKDDEHRQYYDAWLREQYAPKSTTQHTHERNFYDSRMAQDARDFAYRYADMSFDEFSKKLKIKAKKAALTVFHWVGIGITLIVMSVAGIIGREASNAVIKSNSDSKAADQLDELVLEMNRDLPRFLDAETRLDKVHREHKTLVSSHTIVNYKSNEVDPSLIEQNVKETTKGNVCETARLYLQGGYSYRYIYYGNLGSKITEISLNARDCGFTVR